MKKINLDTADYANQFAKAEIYAKKGTIEAVQITEEGLKSGAYASRDVRYDSVNKKFVIDTYVMRNFYLPSQTTYFRAAELEDTRPVAPGEWIATNPKTYESDRENNYAIPDETFWKRYEPTEKPGVYRARGMARIIPNDTGESVEIEAPWGGKQNGDNKCYFCAPYDRDNPDDLAEGDRYILSENDFAAYGLAREVLGKDWR